MSKTVKRVMTVTMVGLVAMLGANAEAHTLWVGGKPRRCSICSKPEDTKVEVPNPAQFPAAAELIVTTKVVTIKCGDDPDFTEVHFLNKKKDQATLIAEAPPSNRWSWDGKTASLDFTVPDKLFEILGFCEGNPPIDVQIHQMTAEYRVSACTDFLCSTKVLLSTRKLNNCTIEPDAIDGTPYTCEGTAGGHAHPTPTQ